MRRCFTRRAHCGSSPGQVTNGNNKRLFLLIVHDNVLSWVEEDKSVQPTVPDASCTILSLSRISQFASQHDTRPGFGEN